MRLKLSCGVLGATAAVWLAALTGVAAAATSPTLKVTGASNISSSAATLVASVNPNGAKTTYHFEYGPTSTLGTSTPTESAGAGTKAVTESSTITGLQSGTTYYFDLVASSSAGTSTTKTVLFKTNGPAPASATTGAAQVLSSSSATLTGVVNTNDAATSYYFEIGTTAGTYNVQTLPQTVAASASPVPVSITVPNLSRSTTFHYVLVASNGANNTSTGADMTFETFPNPVPKPTVTQNTTPKTVKGKPFVFNTLGEVLNKTSTPDALACTGTATVAFYSGKHRIYRQLAPLSSNCTFSATTTFKNLPIKLKKGQKSEKLLVYIRFDGNGYLAPVNVKPETLTLG